MHSMVVRTQETQTDTEKDIMADQQKLVQQVQKTGRNTGSDRHTRWKEVRLRKRRTARSPGCEPAMCRGMLHHLC